MDCSCYTGIAPTSGQQLLNIQTIGLHGIFRNNSEAKDWFLGTIRKHNKGQGWLFRGTMIEKGDFFTSFMETNSQTYNCGCLVLGALLILDLAFVWLKIDTCSRLRVVYDLCLHSKKFCDPLCYKRSMFNVHCSQPHFIPCVNRDENRYIISILLNSSQTEKKNEIKLQGWSRNVSFELEYENEFVF